MVKKITALFLVLVIIVALVGCGAKKREIVKLTLSSEDSTKILAAAGINLPPAETAPGANTVITLYGYQNSLQNYSEDEMVQTGYWTFREMYNCDIDWVECAYDERWTKLANLLLSDDIPDFYEAWATDFPSRALNEMFAPVDDYIDYDSKLFEDMKYYAENFFSLAGKCYMMITDVQFNSIVLYNKRVFNDYGFDDPSELFYNNEWTWDKMLDMGLDFCDPEDNRYVFNNWHPDTAFLTSTGIGVVELDPETGKFYDNVDDPRLERAANMLEEFQKNEFGFPVQNNGWVLNFELDSGGVATGNTLFGMDGVYILDERRTIADMELTYGDITNDEVMIVPVPRDPNGDGEYYIDSKPKGYCLIKDAPHPEAVGLLAMCDRFKIIDPTVINFDKKQLKEKKGWSQDMLDMWDKMYEIAHSHNTFIDFGTGLGDELSNRVSELTNFNVNGAATSWAQRKESLKETIGYLVDELNAQIDALG